MLNCFIHKRVNFSVLYSISSLKFYFNLNFNFFISKLKYVSFCIKFPRDYTLNKSIVLSSISMVSYVTGSLFVGLRSRLMKFKDKTFHRFSSIKSILRGHRSSYFFDRLSFLVVPNLASRNISTKFKFFDSSSCIFSFYEPSYVSQTFGDNSNFSDFNFPIISYFVFDKPAGNTIFREPNFSQFFMFPWKFLFFELYRRSRPFIMRSKGLRFS